jgi:hypothetical protein
VQFHDFAVAATGKRGPFTPVAASAIIGNNRGKESMNFVASRESAFSARLAALLGSASLLKMTNAITAHAQGQQVGRDHTIAAASFSPHALLAHEISGDCTAKR